MLNTNGLWPQTAANGAEADSTDVWGIGSVLETQARLWNHMLDANRSVWEIYLPWFSTGPSLWTAAFAPLQPAPEAREAAPRAAEAVLNGASDVMESQARSWNQFLDANRSLWAAFGWPMPFAGMAGTARGMGAEDEEESTAGTPRSAARKRSGSSSRAR